jgi:hypothetical protein
MKLAFAEYVTVQQVNDVCVKYGILKKDVVPFLKELVPLLEKLA